MFIYNVTVQLLYSIIFLILFNLNIKYSSKSFENIMFISYQQETTNSKIASVRCLNLIMNILRIVDGPIVSLFVQFIKVVNKTIFDVIQSEWQLLGILSYFIKCSRNEMWAMGIKRKLWRYMYWYFWILVSLATTYFDYSHIHLWHHNLFISSIILLVSA